MSREGQCMFSDLLLRFLRFLRRNFLQKFRDDARDETERFSEDPSFPFLKISEESFFRRNNSYQTDILRLPMIRLLAQWMPRSPEEFRRCRLVEERRTEAEFATDIFRRIENGDPFIRQE